MICFILTGARLSLSLMWKLPGNSFMMFFSQIVNEHAPFRRFRVKGRNNPWFSSELSCIIHDRNLAWTKARKSCSDADWLIFRQLRNKCSFLLRKTKSEYVMSVTTDNLTDPRKYWKAIKVYDW